jgi:hypothetical protein
MRIVNTHQFMPDSIDGDQPELLHGVPLGATFPWAGAQIGSLSIHNVTANQVEIYQKVQDNNSNYDWLLVDGWISKKLVDADFTDVTTTGTYTFTEEIPLGAIVDYATVSNVVAFSGDTSAVVTIGDGTDVDRYNTGTPSVFATITYLSIGVPSGTTYHSAAKAPVVTVTTATDYTLVPASASMQVSIHYKR